ncbi:MAG: HAMP domain-containing methyl-accepting chemotaxis protein [Pseudobdellovibrionaceae bacterium]
MRSWGIKIQLYSLTGVLVLGLIFVGSLGVYSTIDLSRKLQNVIENDLPLVRDLTLVDMVHDGVRGASLQAYLGAMTDTDENIDTATKTLAEHEKNVKELLIGMKQLKATAIFTEKLKDVEPELMGYLNLSHAVIVAAKQKDKDLVKNKFAEFEKSFEALEEKLGNMGEYYEQESKQNFSVILSNSDRLKMISIVSLIVALTSGIVLAFVIARSIVKSLTEITKTLVVGAEDLARAIQSLTSTSTELSSASAQQASALQQTASSVEEISSMVQQSSKNALQTETASGESRAKAEQGQEVMREMVQAIADIHSTNDSVMEEVKTSNDRITDIVKVIQEIGSKTKVINEIVFQTKLLSFNASVEAARAGEQGKGFAVVAEEVGNLAKMSGEASKEITVLLEESIAKVSGIAEQTKSNVQDLMAKTEKTVERGSDIAKQCEKILADILSETAKAAGLVSGISVASQEQAKGVEEISNALQQLNQSTQINASSANSCSKTSEVLSAQVSDLQNITIQLKQIVNGTSSEVTEFKGNTEIAEDDSGSYGKAA